MKTPAPTTLSLISASIFGGIGILAFLLLWAFYSLQIAIIAAAGWYLGIILNAVVTFFTTLRRLRKEAQLRLHA